MFFDRGGEAWMRHVSRIPGPVRVRNAAAWGIAGVRHGELWRAGSGVVARPHENRLKPGTGT